MLDACYQAKRIRELLPALPDGVSPSFIQYLDVIEHLQRRNVCVKISDISDALNIPRPGVTHTVKDMVNGALVLQVAYGAVDLPVVGRFGSTGSQVLNLPFAYCMSIQPNASLTKIGLAAPVSTTVGIALNVAFYLHLNQAERKNRHEIASIEKKRRSCASALFFGFSIRRHRPRRLAHAAR